MWADVARFIVPFIDMPSNNQDTTPSSPRSLSLRLQALLDQSRLKDAIALMRKETESFPAERRRVESVDSTYSLMISYFLRGSDDPGRGALLEDLRRDLQEAADAVERSRMVSTAPESYYAESRILAYRPQDLHALLEDYTRMSASIAAKSELGIVEPSELSEREKTLEKIFNLVWTMPLGDRERLKELRDRALASEQEDPVLPAQIVSALLMGLNAWYDRAKVETLLSIHEASATEALAARSLTALVLALARHPKRVAADRRLMGRLEGLKDSLVSYRRLREVVRALVRARDTDRIVSKMRSDVLPGMMQLGPDVLRKMKEATSENDLASLEENPEWEDILRKSGLDEKLRALTEMQLEGADVMMFAFSNLKQFPFFGKISNWFLPFFKSHSLLHTPASQALGDSGAAILDMLEADGIMCDSDRYSFLLALQTMTEQQRTHMAKQFAGQMEGLREMRKDSADAARPEFDVEAEKYIRNLYRFFKLSPKRGDYRDPFAEPLDFMRLPAIGSILAESEIVELLAEFYFKRGHYREAVPMLRRLAEAQGGSGHLWEKLGYSLEKTGAPAEEVLACYLKAELFNPDSRWLARRIGGMHALQGNWRLALDYLERALAGSEKATDLVELAGARGMAGDAKGELALLYKADYLEPGRAETSRMIARAEMRQGNFEKAAARLETTPAEKRSEADNRWLGHARLLMKEYGKAAQAYGLTIRPDQKRREWKTAILADLPLLEPLGAGRDELMLVLESLV